MDAIELAETYTVVNPEQAVVLLNPLRGQIISHMRTPVSAAEIGRAMGETPQRINYHLKALEKVGLVRKIGTRQVRNLVEVLYQAIAKTFVLSDALGLEPATAKRMKEDASLSHLIGTSDKLKRDAMKLMEKTDSGETVHSASLSATISLAGEQARQSFVQEYLEAVRLLTEKYGAALPALPEGHPSDDAADGSASRETYQVLVAVYPTIGEGED